jgi:hypothetical protein
VSEYAAASQREKFGELQLHFFDVDVGARCVFHLDLTFAFGFAFAFGICLGMNRRRLGFCECC